MLQVYPLVQKKKNKKQNCYTCMWGGARVFAWGGGGGKMPRYSCASPEKGAGRGRIWDLIFIKFILKSAAFLALCFTVSIYKLVNSAALIYGHEISNFVIPNSYRYVKVCLNINFLTNWTEDINSSLPLKPMDSFGMWWK